jgi:hypothetical protein
MDTAEKLAEFFSEREASFSGAPESAGAFLSFWSSAEVIQERECAFKGPDWEQLQENSLHPD